MKKLVILLFCCLSVHLLVGQNMNFWTKKNNFSGLKRERMTGIAINNTGYIGFGVDTNEVVHNDWWEYDHILDVWTQKASLPASVRRNACGFAAGGKGYVGMGVDSTEAQTGNVLNDFWQYDPGTNSWMQKANFPGAGGNGIYFATAFSLDNKGFVCCGKRGAALYSKEVWEYKPSSDSWTQRADFPGGLRYQLTSFVINNTAYVGLGTDQNIYRKDIWEYNQGADVWIQKNDFPGGERGSPSAFTLRERGFICLGTDGGLKTDLWEYNPYFDTWAARANYGGSARKEAFAFAIGDRAYVGTGDGYSGKKASVYEYTPMDIIGIGENEQVASISVFPNPVTDHFTITTTDAKISSFELWTIDGRKIISYAASSSNQTTIDRMELTAGVYLLVAYSEDQKIMGTQRLIFSAL
jgi:N-acetylneuraminic acid mutarotase